MWSSLKQLGFEGGRVLEPGCGSGTFIGSAPAEADMIGVELDSTTATITQALYPEAEVRQESFADTKLPDASVDAAIGNVPFADVRLHDPTHNPGRRHSMHNHFILKSLAATKPGGVVAVLTSRYTLDSLNPGARREMYESADLLGAVRLPTGAHRRTAGTEAVTDLLLLRRRKDGEEPQPFVWEHTVPLEVSDSKEQHRINSYFNAHPDRMLGEPRIGHGMHGQETLTIEAADLSAVPAELESALSGIVEQARRIDRLHTPVQTAPVPEREVIDIPDLDTTQLWDGTIIDRDGTFYRASYGVLEEANVPRTQQDELRSLLQLRDTAMSLLDLEANSRGHDAQAEELREQLMGGYQRHVERFGYLNRYTEQRTGRQEPVIDPGTGEPTLDDATGQPLMRDKMRRQYPRVMSTFRGDPNSHLVAALEVWDDSTQTGSPAALLRERQISHRPEVQGADTPAEALAVVLDQVGRVDVERVADLLGLEPGEARAQLGTLIYDDPELQAPVTAAEYLSGNVRTKLEAAILASASDERYAVNVEALQRVQPEPIPAEEIIPRLGSVWINADIHQQFVRELLNDPSAEVENPLPGEWTVRGRRHTVLARETWGTPERPAPDLIKSAMNQSPVSVYDTDSEGNKTFNAVATQAANDKLTAINERFQEWAWENPARATALATEYNRRFNSLVLRDYTDEGRALRLPGLSEQFVPQDDPSIPVERRKGLRDHQRAAVARMINEPAVGLFHQVGAGKTLEMVVGASELRRLGLVKKPLVVVPNHMLEQFSREWLQAYPQARLLVGSTEDVTKTKKAQFVARASTHDWDAIIMSQSSFKNINVAPEIEADYVSRRVAEIDSYLTSAQEANSRTVKQIEKAKLRLQEKMRSLLDIDRTPGMHFEDMGVDYLIVDEAHMYKNLATETNISDAAIAGSQQATDLHMKLEWLRQTQGDRVVTMATATPIANSITETHVMQRYLRPDLLREAGVENFDSWAATFGATSSEMEVSPAGKFRLKTRFSRYVNTPELMRMWHVFADVKTAEDLKLPVPDLAPRSTDGQRAPHTIVVEPTAEFVAYSEEIRERADLLSQAGAVDPTKDNMLKLSSDARKAALDMRMVDPEMLPSGEGKLHAVADMIHHHWSETKDTTYRGRDGEPSPIPGSLQLVFLDLGTPTKDPERFDAYAELRTLLTDRGMDPTKVRFIHEAKNDQEKHELFTAARNGEVSVLIGSTQKMGVGTNVQDRIVALHHVDCPWRPADVEQRDGRGVRQGNQNPEIHVYRYVTEGSFDAYTWQTNERKARFINQIMKGRIDSREVEDVGDQSMSAGEAKALASGNPLLMDKAQADADFTRLRRQYSAFVRSQQNLRFEKQHTTNKVSILSQTINDLEAAQPRTIDTSGDKFTMTIGDRRYTSRADAVEGLRNWAGTHHWELVRTTPETPLRVATLGGHTVTAHVDSRIIGTNRDRFVVFQLDGVPRSNYELRASSLAEADMGTIRALENRVTAIPQTLAKAKAELLAANEQLDHIAANEGKPFKYEKELREAESRVKQLDAKIAAQQRSSKEHAAQPATQPHLRVQGGPTNPRDAARPEQSPQSPPVAAPPANPRDAARPSFGAAQPSRSTPPAVPGHRFTRTAEHETQGPSR